MSILKYIMSPFVEFKENEQPGNIKKPELQTDQKYKSSSSAEDNSSADFMPAPSAVTYKPSQPSTSATASSLSDYQKHFEDLIEEANSKNPLFQGTDFKEFIDSKIDVEAIADEGTRYKTAFNVLKRTGLTKDRLITTGREYVTIIEQDLKEFEGAYSQQYKTEVELKESILQQKAQELQALNDKLSILNKEIKDISTNLVESKQRLNVNKDAFLKAGEIKKKELQTELQKIDQYFL